MEKIIIVDGMSCNHCVMSVTKALEAIGGKNININLDTKEVKLEAGNIDNESLKEAIDDIGFDVLEIK
ncbi:MAG TPA: cation transporter [Tissierellaceae bacterium]